jgi:DNA-binding XRE family transcriptional regulator
MNTDKKGAPAPDQIRARRMRLNMTQAEAAGVLGLSQRTWQQYELGTRNMSPSNWHAFIKQGKKLPPKPSTGIKRGPVETLSDIEKQCSKSPSGCWMWNALLSPAGYPVASRHGKPIQIHRLVYTMVNRRQLDKTISVIRTCGKRECVNPAHLNLALRTPPKKKIAETD